MSPHRTRTRSSIRGSKIPGSRIPGSRISAALAILLAAAACSDGPPPAGSFGYHIVTLALSGPAAAAAIELNYDPARLEFAGAAPVPGTVLLVGGTDVGAGVATVGLLAREGVAGEVALAAFLVKVEGAESALGTTIALDRDGAVQPVSVGVASQHGSALPSTIADYDPELRAAAIDASLPSPELTAPASTPALAGGSYGDVDGDGTVDLYDALAALNIADGAVHDPDDHARFHAGAHDGRVDASDVLTVLRKAVDADLPARLIAFPTHLSFEQLQQGRVALIANAGNTPLAGLAVTGTPGVTPSLLAGHPNTVAAYGVDVAPGAWGGAAVRADATGTAAVEVAIGNDVFLIAGQSNAAGWGLPLAPAEAPHPSVRMLGNDYQWKTATEPVDSASGQLDTVSIDDPVYHSFGVALGKHVHEAGGRLAYLIPAAAGGTPLSLWQPTGNPIDRSTLFGSATFRARTSAGTAGAEYGAEGGPVTALLWYQGEQDAQSLGARNAFITNTNAVMDAFVQQLSAPVISVQLAGHASADDNERQQIVREYQRLMETGASVATGSGGPQPRADHFLVVAHDLALNATDEIHVDAEGQRELGRRIGLAYRQHVLGHDVDGTGPRLVAIEQSGSAVRVRTDRTIAAHGSYDGYFSVRDASGPVAISSVGRDPSDDTTVLIQLAQAPSSPVTVRYMPPAGKGPFPNAVRDAASGLPLPAFGTHGEQ